MARWTIGRAAICAAALASRALGDQILVTTGFTTCDSDDSVEVQRVEITYNNDAKTITFDVAGMSKSVQNITAALTIRAYGQDVYTKSFNPCDSDSYMADLCPGKLGLRGASVVSRLLTIFDSQVWVFCCNRYSGYSSGVC